MRLTPPWLLPFRTIQDAIRAMRSTRVITEPFVIATELGRAKIARLLQGLEPPFGLGSSKEPIGTLPPLSNKRKENRVSYRMQHGGRSQAIADEDQRLDDEHLRRATDKELAAYYDSGRLSTQSPRVLESIASRLLDLAATARK